MSEYSQRLEQERAHALTAGRAAHRHPTQPSEPLAEQQPAGAHDAPISLGDELGGLVVAPVAVGVHRHALLDAEHLVA